MVGGSSHTFGEESPDECARAVMGRTSVQSLHLSSINTYLSSPDSGPSQVPRMSLAVPSQLAPLILQGMVGKCSLWSALLGGTPVFLREKSAHSLSFSFIFFHVSFMFLSCSFMFFLFLSFSFIFVIFFHFLFLFLFFFFLGCSKSFLFFYLDCLTTSI